MPLGQGDRGPGRSWRPAPVHPFRRVDGTAAAGDMRVWTITELLTDRDLVLEGQAMRHCVAAYADRCARGQASVWTLRVETGRGGRRALTVEVDPAGRVVRQARGTANRRPRPAELDVLAAWAAAEGLRVPDPERL